MDSDRVLAMNTCEQYMIDRYFLKVTISLDGSDIKVPYLSPIAMTEAMYAGALMYSDSIHEQMWFVLHPPSGVGDNHLVLSRSFNNSLFQAWVRDLCSHCYSKYPHSELMDRLARLRDVSVRADLDGDELLLRALADWEAL